MNKFYTSILALLIGLCGAGPGANADQQDRPNILFAFAEDMSYPHMSAYGTEWVETPAFDRVAEQGILFDNAYVNNPKCGPLRASVLTGRHSWQLGPAAHHGGIFPEKYKVYTEVLAEDGYHVGYTGKGWGPGRVQGNRRLTGKKYRDSNYSAGFKAFLSDRDDHEPFCFWYGAHEAHRGYEYGSGVDAEKKRSAVELPPYWPDEKRVRKDVLDYAVEVEQFDHHLGHMLNLLEEQNDPRVSGRGYFFQKYGQIWSNDASSYYRKYMNGNADKQGWVNPSDYDPTHRPYWGGKTWERTKED